MKMAEKILTNVPQGFASAVEKVSTIPQDILAELCQDAAEFLQYKISQIPVEKYDKKFQQAGVDCNAKTAFNVVSFIFRSAGKARCTADQLVAELNSSLLWNESSLAAVKHIWKEQGKFVCSPDIAHTLNVGKLVDMQWKLSIGMGSSSCRSLNAPYITTSLTVVDPSGNLKTKTFEMTIAEFKKFSSHIREIASVLETV